MTNDEAIEELKRVDTLDMPIRLCEAYYMSLKALEQEPCGDSVSRQAVLDLAEKGILVGNHNYKSVCNAINDLPSVNPQEPCEVSEYDKDHIWYKGGQYISLRRFLEAKAEAEQEPKTGHWIEQEGRNPHCSVCGGMSYKYNFCPCCGARMVVRGK